MTCYFCYGLLGGIRVTNYVQAESRKEARKQARKLPEFKGVKYIKISETNWEIGKGEKSKT